MLNRIIHAIEQYFCHHRDIVRTGDDGMLFTECLNCGSKSGGIQTGRV